jgi:RNA polymerase sigma-70 factor (ECF subfamily)
MQAEAAEAKRRLFDEVISPHLDDAYSLARWLTGNATDAEDVVQDACLRAFRGLDGFAGQSSRAWLLTVVRNAAHTWISKNRPKTVIMTDDLEDAERRMPDHELRTATPESELIASVEAKRLEDAVSRLPLLFKEAIVMREINGASYREISEVLQVPIGTVMSRLARARSLLIRSLAEGPA